MQTAIPGQVSSTLDLQRKIMPTIEVNRKRYEYNMDPDHCPICHHGVMPKQLSANNIERSEMQGDILQIVYVCPRSKCQMVFIGTYRQNIGYNRHYPQGAHILKYTEPYRVEPPKVPDEIKKISPGYVELLSQSAAAEAHQLNQIAGTGYRKALEFLIKDYTISINPKEKEEIEKSFLGVCIDNFVSDENIKACAKRAAWLGNDETHYVKKWIEKDIDDLKKLIRLTEAWILNCVLTQNYLKDMK